uniref:Aldo-keto reductase family 7, member A3 (aflatoxin aldehyde reductase) n=1 Tax=Oncorhynchus mykiss TaxID=8022 RepID=A0A8C7S1F7_ONCMY
HAPDHQNTIQDTLQACHELHDGKYKELGLPNYIASEVAEIVTHTESLHLSLTTLFCNLNEGNVMFLNYYNKLNNTIKHYLWMIHVFYVRYWKECHSQDIELVQKTLETVYGSDKQTMTYAALHWMYHHSHLKKYLGYSVITGMSCIDQLQQNPFASEGPLDERVVEAFQQVWDLVAPITSNTGLFRG